MKRWLKRSPSPLVAVGGMRWRPSLPIGPVIWMAGPVLATWHVTKWSPMPPIGLAITAAWTGSDRVAGEDRGMSAGSIRRIEDSCVRWLDWPASLDGSGK